MTTITAVPNTVDLSLREATHPPCLPDNVRRRHAAFIASDTRFAAAARLLSALWRADRGLPAGIHIELGQGGKTRRVRAGWRLTRESAHAGAAFLHPDILGFMRKALVLREPGAMWDAPKIMGNLLASQGLALNLFVPQALDLDLATRIWSTLLPAFVHQVTHVAFETSPGRGEARFLTDGTAFDIRLDVVTPDGELAFIAIELKFIEALIGPAASSRPRHVEAARAVNLFVDPDAAALYRPGLEQLRREHSLAQLMVDEGLYGRGLFVLTGPALNRRVTASAKLYAAELRDMAGATPDRVGFVHLTLEAILSAMRVTDAGELAQALHDRYLDMRRVTVAALIDEPPPTPSAPATPCARPATTTVRRIPGTVSAAIPGNADAVVRPRRHRDTSTRPSARSGSRSRRPTTSTTSQVVA